MAKFTYLGLSTEEKKRRLKLQMKDRDPPEKRGHDPKYHWAQEDSPMDIEKKKVLTEKWLKEQEKDVIAKIEAQDKQVAFKDPQDVLGEKVIVFEKGKAVEIPETHPLFPKLKSMSAGVPTPNTNVKIEVFKMDGAAPKPMK